MSHTQTTTDVVFKWTARLVFYSILIYSGYVIFDPAEQAMLLKLVYTTITWSLQAAGGTIPAGDLHIVGNTIWLAGWSVSVDANLWLVAVFPFLRKRYWLPVIVLITLTHAFAGYLGLAILISGMMIGLATGLVLFPTSWLGFRFIVGGLLEGEGDDPRVMAMQIVAGILTATAFLLYWAVSFDEFFMVLQRFQWMVGQEWSYAAQAVIIALSMIILMAMMLLVALFYLAHPGAAAWVAKHGDHMMLAVFGLIMYYLVRGVVQNGFGHVPWEDPYFGIAPYLFVVGMAIVLLLRKWLTYEIFEKWARRLLLLNIELIKSISQMRIVWVEKEEAEAAQI